MRKEDNTAGLAERTSVKMWPGILSGIIIGLIAFILSFDALRLVFVACGINPYLSWGGPVCVDGTILLCTWATWGFKKGHIRGSWYPWAGLVLFSGFSIGGNALHAIINTGYELPAWVPPVIMSIPPVAMLYATHLIVIIAGDRLDKTNTILDTAESASKTMRTEPVGEPVEDRSTVPPTPPSFTPTPDPEPSMPVLPDLSDLSDLSDWRIPVPDMEADVHPKAFEAEAASAAQASTASQAVVPTVAGENIDAAPVPSMPADPAPAQDVHDVAGPEPSGPVAESRTQPEQEPASEPTVENVAAGDATADGAVPPVPEPRSHVRPEYPVERPGTRRRAAADDDAWNAWLDRLDAEGGAATAAMAVEAGLASSLSTAKRHLARIRRQRAERS